MLGRALSSLLVASAAVVGCNLLTGVDDLDVGAPDAGIARDGAPGPATTSTAAPPAVDSGTSSTSSSSSSSSSGGALDSGVDADADADAAGPPLTGDFNGHHYEVVLAPPSVTWTEARDEATKKGGHLATITSPEENDFVRELTLNAGAWGTEGQGPWLGGFQDIEAGVEPDGGWQWVTGEPFSFTSWLAGEPNNQDGNEDFLGFYGDQDNGTWNDFRENGDGVVMAYVIEYEP